MKEKLNIKKHVEDISKNLSEIREGIKNADLSLGDISEVKAGF